ncbi:MAG: glycosyltransferase, partial [Bacteroidales bacterium]
MNYLVSIIMPVYNGEKYLKDAVNSVLEQSYKEFELIIIDDCSTDTTSQILAEYEKMDSRIKVYYNNKNLGVSKSLNLALNMAKGMFIARIDSDDVWFKEKLRKQIEHLANNPSTYLLGTAKKVINESGNIINTKEKQFFAYAQIKRQILKNNLFCHSSVIFRRSILNDAGYYNERFLNSEDYEFWIRVLAKRKAEILPEPLVYYRLHKDMIS